MNKKSSLLIGALSTVAIAIPLVVTTSCTETTGMQYIGIMAKQIVTANITDKEVTASTMTKQTLDKVFDGITTVNFNQFTSAWDASNNKIILTSKEGSEFGLEKNKMESIRLKPVIDLNISLNTDIVNTAITEKEINADPITKETLAKAYNGITDENMKHFTVSYVKIPNINPPLYAFILVANEGYGFNNQMGNQLPSMTFNVIEDITYIDITVKTEITTRITDQEINANPISKLTLDKAFDGITDMNFSHFISNWDSVNNKIILTAGPGYKFGSSAKPISSIDSVQINAVKALNISLNRNVHNYLITKEEIDAPQIYKATLDKAFIGITDENMKNFTTSVGTINKLYFLVLTANDGYGFGDRIGDQLVSMTFNVTNIIDITAKLTPDKIYKQELEGNISIDTLSKAFTGVKLENFNYFTVSLNDVKNKIILTAKPGYKFGTEAAPTDSIESAEISYVSALDITAITGIIKISNSELTADKLTANTIKKAFNVLDEDIDKFDAKWNATTNIITLTANPGFEFGTTGSSSPTLNSNIITPITLLAITVKDPIIEKIYDTDLTGTISITTLEKVFNGIVAADLANIEVAYEAGIITLTAKAGFEFGNTTTSTNIIKSVKITPITILNIELNENVKIPESELSGTITIPTLQKAFTFDNTISAKFRFRFDKLERKFVLEALDGYEFKTQAGNPTTSLNSNPITVQLDITAKQVIEPTDKIFLSELVGDKFKVEILNKVFGGITPENYDFIATTKWTATRTVGTITLTLKDGYEFNITTSTPLNTLNSISITALSLLEISQKQGPISIPLIELINPTLTHDTLMKAFNGTIAPEYTSQFTATWDSKTNIITLEAKPGFEFGNTTLSTNKIISVEITSTLTKLGITEKTITETIYDNELNGSTIDILILQKLFDGIDSSNLDNFTYSFDSVSKIVTLTAKPGYEFNNSTGSLNSNEIPFIKVINISQKQGTISIPLTELVDPLSNDTLMKAFDGIIAPDYASQFTATWVEKTGIITLKAQPGFVFENKMETITSNQITTSFTPLNITVKSTVVKILESDFNAAPTLSVLQSIFNEITNIDVFETYIWNTDRTITLTLKKGYVFETPTVPNSPNVLTSNPVIVQLNIKANTTVQEISITDLNAKPLNIDTLNKVFNTITDKNNQYIISNWNSTGRTIDLTLQDGYEFLDTVTNSLKSLPITVKMNITVKSTVVKILESDFNAAPTLSVLQSIFNEITDLAIFETYIWNPDRTITLTLNNGYIFETPTPSGPTNILKSNPVIIQLNIKTNPSIKLLESEIINIISEAILLNVFNGSTTKNLKYVVASWNPSTREITLTPNTGYEFETPTTGETTLVSNPVIIQLGINVKPEQVTILELDIKDPNAIPPVILNNVFGELTAYNIDKFTAAWDLGTRRITLTPKTGYEFLTPTLNTNTLVSNEIIVTFETTVKQVPDDISELELTASPIVIETLQKAFDGITLENYKYITSNWNPLLRQITLTPAKGYIFKNANSTSGQDLVSKTIIHKMNIKSRTAINVSELEFNETAIKLETLQKVFDGIDINNKDFFVAKWNKGDRTITLTAKHGYEFLTPTNPMFKKVLTSSPVTVKLNIIAKKSIQPTDKIFLSELVGDKIKVEILNKVFEGITPENYKFIATTQWKVTRTVGIITLTLNDGYEFETAISTSLTTLDSISITALSLLDISQKPGPISIPLIELMNPPLTHDTLMKAFNGTIGPDYTSQFTANWNKDTNIITLTAQPGFEFGNTTSSTNSIISVEITSTPTTLNIDKRNPADKIYEGELTTANIGMAILGKLFTGIDNNNFNNFISSWDPTAKTVTLTANEGYEFSNSTNTLIFDSIIPITPLEISQKQGPISIPLIELMNPTLTHETLMKAFNGTIAPNYASQFTANWNKDTNIITLTAQPGFEFGNTTSSTNSIISVEITSTSTTLNIDKRNPADKIYEGELTTANIGMAILGKLFTGIDNNNFNKFTSSWDPTAKTVTLTANEGYEFSNSTNTLIFDSIIPITPLAIDKKTLTGTIYVSDLTTISNDTLAKLFSGIDTTEDYSSKFDAIWTSDTTNPTGPVKGVITLTAKPGYEFGTKNNSNGTITSEVITPITLLNIVPKSSTDILSTPIYQSEIDAKPITKETLNKIFTGTIGANYTEFTASWKPGTDPTKGTITLTPNPGFAFANTNLPTDSIESIEITITNNNVLDITAKADADITGIKISKSEIEANPITKDTLDKIFNVLAGTDYSQFTATWKPGTDPTKGKITLTANPGYQFNALGSPTAEYILSSVEITLDDTALPFKSNIQAKVVSAKITEAEVMANPISKETLEKAFDGITDQNFDKFNASWDAVNKKIILSLKK
ncbi:MAG: hypothetical protein ACRDAW_02405 [Metamycoplasmataceae bacterium]